MTKKPSKVQINLPDEPVEPVAVEETPIVVVEETPIERLPIILSDIDDGMKLPDWQIKAAEAALRDGAAPLPNENRRAVRVPPPEEAAIAVYAGGERQLFVSNGSKRVAERWMGVARLHAWAANGHVCHLKATRLRLGLDPWLLEALETTFGRGDFWNPDNDEYRRGVGRKLEKVVPVTVEGRVKMDNEGASFSEVILVNTRWLSFRRVSLMSPHRASTERTTNYPYLSIV